MLVELHFHGPGRGQGGDAGAAVVQQQLFVLAAVALEYGQVDMLAEQVLMAGAVGVVAGFQHGIDDFAKGIEQTEENVEQALARDRGDEHGDLEAGLAIAIDLDAVAFRGHDLAIEGRPDGVGEPEVAVVVLVQVGGHFFGVHGKTLRPMRGARLAGSTAGEAVPVEV